MTKRKNFVKWIVIIVLMALFVNFTHIFSVEEDSKVVFSTILGTKKTDIGIITECSYYATSMTIDSLGNAWVTGTFFGGNTQDFLSKGSPQLPFQQQADDELSYYGFLKQYSPQGNLLYSSLFSGDGATRILESIRDSQDNLIIAGWTSSDSFPLVPSSPEQTNENDKLFLLKLSPSLEIQFSTLLGGSGKHDLSAITIDANDQIYMAGTTTSSDFPLKHPLMDHFNDYWNTSFIVKYSEHGELMFSAYFGGSAGGIKDIKIDHQNNILIAGNTCSWDFPGAETEPQIGSRGAGFISKISSSYELVFTRCLERKDVKHGSTIQQIQILNNGQIMAYVRGKTIDWEPLNKYYYYTAVYSSDGELLSLRDLPFWILISTTKDITGNLFLGGIGIIESTGFIDAPKLYEELTGRGGTATLASYLPDGTLFFIYNFGGGFMDCIYSMVIDGENYLWLTGTTRSTLFPIKGNDQGWSLCNGTISFLTRIQLPPSLAMPNKLLLQIGQEKATFMEKGKVTLLPPLEAPPMIVQGRTLIPVRVLAETMGMEVSWVSVGQYIWLDREGMRLELQIGRNFAWKYALDNPEKREKLEMDVPPMIVNNRTLLPLRFVTENFGALVDWNGVEQKILVSWE